MSVQEAYNRWAEQYDDNDNRTRDLNMQRLRRADLPIAGARVFEAGRDTGLNTEFLAGQGAQVVAMDFSEPMLERARARVKQSSVRFEVGDATQRWQAEDDSCHLVVITLVLEHVENLAPGFTQARRVLRNGDLLYLHRRTASLSPARGRTGPVHSKRQQPGRVRPCMGASGLRDRYRSHAGGPRTAAPGRACIRGP